MALTMMITGASGFLGHALQEAAAANWPRATVVPIRSPRDGGPDLTAPGAASQLAAMFPLEDPENTVLIHAAARVALNTMDGLTANAAMATNLALWARDATMGFAVLVSSVSVYAPLPYADLQTPCEPKTFYGQGKCAAEEAWRLIVPPQRAAIVRLAGIWGWQPKPTLFWNRLLLAAAGASEGAPLVKRAHSRRNYISSHEASECLLHVGVRRMPGVFLGAGKDVTDTRQFIEAVQRLTESNLSVDWQDDGQVDECLYHPSEEFSAWLKPFPESLAAMWSAQPDWVCSR